MKKVLMLATTAAMSEQFNKNNILILEEMGCEVHVAGNFLEGNPISEERLENFKTWLEEHHGKWFHISATRKPTDLKNNVRAYKQIIFLIKKYKYDFIHCHTPIGSVIGRIAAHRTHTKVAYTAHGFHFYKSAPLKNWLLYYPIELILSYWTDVLILINNEDYRRAKKKFYAKKTVQIPGIGVETKEFMMNNIDVEMKRQELGISGEQFVLLSVGELKEHKNHQVIIEALYELNNPNIIFLLVGKGELEEKYRLMIREFELEKNVKILGFRNDVKDLCKIANCFVHPSIREGLGIAPLEAMASGLPLIASKDTGMKDYTEDGVSGYCVDAKDVGQMAEAIRKMFSDAEFCKKCGKNNLETVKKYDINNTNSIMIDVYMELIK